MNVFELRERLISDYSSYIRSFIRIRDERVDALVTSGLDQGRLWPDPHAGTVDDFVAEGLLHSECSRVCRAGKDRGEGKTLRLYQHQADAIRRARAGRNYVLTTGTGSLKSLAYIIPIVDHVLRNGSGRGIQAIVVYLMNALASSQAGELHKFLQLGYPDRKGPVTFARYTGQERDEDVRKEATLESRAGKLLSFTDNRRDASLQAGHFNDFVEIGLLRSALLKACSANPGGLSHQVVQMEVRPDFMRKKLRVRPTRLASGCDLAVTGGRVFSNDGL